VRNARQVVVAMAGDLQEIEEEYGTVHRQYLLTFFAALTLLVIGAITYHQLLKLSWINAFYFCTVTLTTVGYGDITPSTDAAKLFTIFYILFGIGIIATFASLLVRNASLRRELRRTRRKSRHS
jgi:voltage-gated potassium channel Kch